MLLNGLDKFTENSHWIHHGFTNDSQKCEPKVNPW